MFHFKYKILDSLSFQEQATIYSVRARFSKRRYLAKKTKPAQHALEELDHLHSLQGKPGMPELHDFYVNRSRAWLVFRWYRGGTLYDRIEEYNSVLRCRSLLRDLACVVRSAHDANIAHLNIRPENFVFDRTNQVRLVDFTHAKTMYNAWLNSLIAPVGSEPYAAPETQVTHMPYFTRTTDVYSLGIIYSLLTRGTATRRDEQLQREMTYENPTQRPDVATVIERLTELLPRPPPLEPIHAN